MATPDSVHVAYSDHKNALSLRNVYFFSERPNYMRIGHVYYRGHVIYHIGQAKRDANKSKRTELSRAGTKVAHIGLCYNIFSTRGRFAALRVISEPFRDNIIISYTTYYTCTMDKWMRLYTIMFMGYHAGMIWLRVLGDAARSCGTL